LPDTPASLGPLVSYQRDLAQGIIVEDAAQLHAVEELEQLHQ